MLLANLLDSIEIKWQVSIDSIELNLCGIRDIGELHDEKVFRNWYTDGDRRLFIKELFKHGGVENVSVTEKPYKEMEHFRYFEIETESHCITIRPDGGIAHGWVVTPGSSFSFRGKATDQIREYEAVLKNSFINPQRDVKLLTALVVEEIK
jgi:hypothetical protein